MEKKSKPLDVLIQFLGDMNEWESSFFREKFSLIEKGTDTKSCSEYYKKRLNKVTEKLGTIRGFGVWRAYNV
jgi:hypothetical protein